MENSENKYSFDPQILKALIEQGPNFLMELLRLGMNEAMKVERGQFLNAGAYQRTEMRLGHANGFKPKTLNTDRLHSQSRKCGIVTFTRNLCRRGYVPRGP